MTDYKGKSLVAFLVFLFLSVPAYAGKKEVQKQIDALNEQLLKAATAGDLQTAIGKAEEALELARKEFSEEGLETAKAMNNVANLYMYAGHAGEAELLYKNAILIETGHDPAGLALADSFSNLAMAYGMQKKYNEARKTLDRAYKIRMEKLGPDHPDTKKILTALDQIRAESKGTS